MKSDSEEENEARKRYYRQQRNDEYSKYRRQFAPVHEDQDPTKRKLFWNGFNWVYQIHSLNKVDPNFLAQTKKARRMKITNVPLYLGL